MHYFFNNRSGYTTTDLKILEEFAATEIRPDLNLVLKHLRVLEEMVRIDNRSFSVNEFVGDRKT